jgi:phage terminase large subunit
VFENWEAGEFTALDYWYGMDFGFSVDPTVLIKVGINKATKTIYLKEECYEIGLTTSAIAAICAKVCGNSLIIADSAEPRLISELKARPHRLNVQGAQKISIVEGVVLMNDYRIIVDGDNLKKELSLYRWADKGKTVPIDKYNHAIDAARYGVVFKLANPNYGKYAIG